jgi:hypothetical protein
MAKPVCQFDLDPTEKTMNKGLATIAIVAALLATNAFRAGARRPT